MHKVSRTLLLAGVLAFGTLTAACGDKVELTQVGPVVGVSNVTVSPSNASVTVGQSIQLAASVTADASTAKTVTWTSSNAAVATVDQTGKVTGVAAGNVTIIATSTADASKTSAAAVSVIASGPTTPITVPLSIGINSVTDVAGNPVQLGNANGQLNVTVNTSGGGLIEVFLSNSCTTNTISATDVAVASQQATSAQAGTVTLSFNTAQLTAANQARFANGNYCIKTRLTNGTQTAVATNTTAITLNNQNSFRSTATFASQTGGPTSAVSTLNGLNYNQGTLTATVTPVIFTSASAPALISGYLTRMGEQAGGAGPVGNATFTNVAVTAGVATIVFPDTLGSAAARSIYQYTSTPAGDTLVITSATDAAGNSIAVTNGAIATQGFAGLRIDNDNPILAGGNAVNASNGYLAANYAFSSGNTTPAATDVKGTSTVNGVAGTAIQGVGGVTTTYYVGTAGSTAFGTANSCNVTGLTAATTAADLANTTNNTSYAAKVVVKDALGNSSCRDVTGTFGVDKIAPVIADSTGNAGVVAASGTGYNTSRQFAFSLIDTISGFTGTPLNGTIVRNFTPSAANCVTPLSPAPPAPQPAFNTTTGLCNTQQFANGTDITAGTNTPGYYTISVFARDQAGNVTGTVTKTVAFDNVAPTLGTLSQSPAAGAALGSVTISGTANDNLDLATAFGNLTYGTASPGAFSSTSNPISSTFDATLTQTATASVSLSNIFRGLQTTTAGNVILANAQGPVGNLYVGDVASNLSTPIQQLAIAMATASTNIQAGNQFTITPTSAAPSTRQTTSVMTVRVIGSTTDAAFQSQPFSTVEIYRLSGGALTLVGTNTLAQVSDNGPVRTYTYNTTVALNPAGGAVNNTFYAVGRNAAGDAVISNAATVTNP